MNDMRSFQLPTKFSGTIAKLIGNAQLDYCQTVTNARTLGSHPFGLSFKGLHVGPNASYEYPIRQLYLLAHMDEPDESFKAFTCVVRFLFNLQTHCGQKPYLRTFDAGDYQFFEIGSYHGVYLCGHPIEANAYHCFQQPLEDMFFFLAGFWHVPIERAVIPDQESATLKCSELKLLFCDPCP